MTAFLRRAWVFMVVYYALMISYRAEILMWAIATALPLIMMGVWAEAGASGAFAEFGLDETTAARYFIAVFLVRQFSIAWVIYDFEYHVVSGKLSPFLLQPIDVAWRWVVPHLSEQVARLPFAALLTGLAIWMYPSVLDDGQGGWWLPRWDGVLLCVVATYAAFAVRFVMQYTLAMLAFWFERVASFDRVLMLPYLFFSGLLAPIQVFEGVAGGSMLLSVVMWTPFPYMLWFPANLLLGEAMPVPIAQGAVVITAWFIGLLMLNRWMWHRGLRHYSAMGA